ncbi:hypothetical protein BLNAU_817 [Blattamonas nauphoetae]|uniref:TmcB/TmcC TPR repeats domain-containing protein n=1 Tax=Blattamonas nauphoetae TaxID=2049346 RepID=A0ABQ9YKL2_9EUKA|nr:hypothetical protein BLNAU_817 [Blattamonas nauphoetae]
MSSAAKSGGGSGDGGKETSSTSTEKISRSNDFIFSFLYPLARQEKKGTPVIDFILWLIHFIEYQAISLFRNHLPFPEKFYEFVSFLTGQGFSTLSNTAFWVCFGLAIGFFLILVIFLFIVSRGYKFFQKSFPWVNKAVRGYAKFYFWVLVIPSYVWFLNFFLWSYDHEADPIDYLFPNPSIKAFSVEHIIGMAVSCVFGLLVCGAHIVYNWYCCDTNPKGGALFARNLGFWGLLLAADDFAEVVTSFTVSPFWIWRATGLSLWKAFFTYLFWSGKHLYQVEGNMLICINFLVGMVIDLASLVSMTLNDTVSAKVVIFVLTAIFIIAVFPFVLILFPKRFRSLWWLHLPGGEMYIDPYNPSHCKLLKDKDPNIFTRAPLRPKRLWVIEVEHDKQIHEKDKDDWKKEDERIQNEMNEKKILRDEEENLGEQARSSVIVEKGKGPMTEIDVIAPPHTKFDRPHLPKIKELDSIEPSVRFIYLKKWRNKRRLAYVDQIYTQAIARFPESPELDLTYATYLHWFMKDNKRAQQMLQAARQHHPTGLQEFIIFIGSREWAVGAEGGDSNLSAISQQELNENLPVAEHYHKEARTALRTFWENFLRPQPDYSIISALLETIGKNQKLAKKYYERLLHSYPSAPRLLRSYGDFLFEVMRDDETAEIYITRAEEFEDEERERKGLNITVGQLGEPSKTKTEGGDKLSDLEERQKEIDREKNQQRMAQIKKRRAASQKKQKNQALQLIGMDMAGRSAQSSHNSYLLLILLVALLVIGGVLASFFISNSYCAGVSAHLNSFYSVGQMFSLYGRLMVLAKLTYLLDQNIYPSIDQPARDDYFYNASVLKELLTDTTLDLYNILTTYVGVGDLQVDWETPATYIHAQVRAGRISATTTRSTQISDILRSHNQNMQELANAVENMPLSESSLTGIYSMLINGPGIIAERTKLILVKESGLIDSSRLRSSIIIIVILAVAIVASIILLLLYVWKVVKKAMVHTKSSLLIFAMVPKSQISSILTRLQETTDAMALNFDLAATLGSTGVTHATVEGEASSITPTTTPKPGRVTDVFAMMLQDVRNKSDKNTPSTSVSPRPDLFDDDPVVSGRTPSPQFSVEISAADGIDQIPSSKTHNSTMTEADGATPPMSPKNTKPTFLSAEMTDGEDMPQDLRRASTLNQKRKMSMFAPRKSVANIGQSLVPGLSAADLSSSQDMPETTEQKMEKVLELKRKSTAGLGGRRMSMMPRRGTLLPNIDAAKEEGGKGEEGKDNDDAEEVGEEAFHLEDEDKGATTERSLTIIDPAETMHQYRLDVPPTPASPSAAGAVHFDLAELNTKVQSEREYKEWLRNVKFAISDVQSKTLNFPSVLRISVVIRLGIAVLITVGLGIATILITYSSLLRTNVYGNQIILGGYRTMQLLHMQYLAIQVVIGSNLPGLVNMTYSETTSPVFTDLTHLLYDQVQIQERLITAAESFQALDAHLRYGSSLSSSSNDPQLDKLSTSKLEGDVVSLDNIMFSDTDCLMDTTAECTGDGAKRNHLLTTKFAGLDALMQIFVEDALHVANYIPAPNLVNKIHFLRLFTISNNDLYYGSLRYNKQLLKEAESFVGTAKTSITIITVVDSAVFILTALILLLPLRAFFTEISNDATLLQSLIPEITHEELQWKEEYQSKFEPLNAGNAKILDLLMRAVEIGNEQKEEQGERSALNLLAAQVMVAMKEQFRKEKKWMEEYAYEDWEEHLREHKYLLREASYLLRFLLHQPQNSLIVSNVLQLFFVSHVQRMDVTFGQHIIQMQELEEERKTNPLAGYLDKEEIEALELSEDDLKLLTLLLQKYDMDPHVVISASESGLDIMSLLAVWTEDPEIMQYAMMGMDHLQYLYAKFQFMTTEMREELEQQEQQAQMNMMSQYGSYSMGSGMDYGGIQTPGLQGMPGGMMPMQQQQPMQGSMFMMGNMGMGQGGMGQGGYGGWGEKEDNVSLLSTLTSIQVLTENSDHDAIVTVILQANMIDKLLEIVSSKEDGTVLMAVYDILERLTDDGLTLNVLNVLYYSAVADKDHCAFEVGCDVTAHLLRYLLACQPSSIVRNEKSCCGKFELEESRQQTIATCLFLLKTLIKVSFPETLKEEVVAACVPYFVSWDRHVQRLALKYARRFIAKSEMKYFLQFSFPNNQTDASDTTNIRVISCLVDLLREKQMDYEQNVRVYHVFRRVCADIRDQVKQKQGTAQPEPSRLRIVEREVMTKFQNLMKTIGTILAIFGEIAYKSEELEQTMIDSGLYPQLGRLLDWSITATSEGAPPPTMSAECDYEDFGEALETDSLLEEPFDLLEPLKTTIRQHDLWPPLAYRDSIRRFGLLDTVGGALYMPHILALISAQYSLVKNVLFILGNTLSGTHGQVEIVLSSLFPNCTATEATRKVIVTLQTLYSRVQVEYRKEMMRCISVLAGLPREHQSVLVRSELLWLSWNDRMDLDGDAAKYLVDSFVRLLSQNDESSPTVASVLLRWVKTRSFALELEQMCNYRLPGTRECYHRFIYIHLNVIRLLLFVFLLLFVLSTPGQQPKNSDHGASSTITLSTFAKEEAGPFVTTMNALSLSIENDGFSKSLSKFCQNVEENGLLVKYKQYSPSDKTELNFVVASLTANSVESGSEAIVISTCIDEDPINIALIHCLLAYFPRLKLTRDIVLFVGTRRGLDQYSRTYSRPENSIIIPSLFYGFHLSLSRESPVVMFNHVSSAGKTPHIDLYALMRDCFENTNNKYTYPLVDTAFLPRLFPVRSLNSSRSTDINDILDVLTTEIVLSGFSRYSPDDKKSELKSATPLFTEIEEKIRTSLGKHFWSGSYRRKFSERKPWTEFDRTLNTGLSRLQSMLRYLTLDFYPISYPIDFSSDSSIDHDDDDDDEVDIKPKPADEQRLLTTFSPIDSLTRLGLNHLCLSTPHSFVSHTSPIPEVEEAETLSNSHIILSACTNALVQIIVSICSMETRFYKNDPTFFLLPPPTSEQALFAPEHNRFVYPSLHVHPTNAHAIIMHSFVGKLPRPTYWSVGPISNVMLVVVLMTLFSSLTPFLVNLIRRLLNPRGKFVKHPPSTVLVRVFLRQFFFSSCLLVVGTYALPLILRYLSPSYHDQRLFSSNWIANTLTHDLPISQETSGQIALCSACVFLILNCAFYLFATKPYLTSATLRTGMAALLFFIPSFLLGFFSFQHLHSVVIYGTIVFIFILCTAKDDDVELDERKTPKNNQKEKTDEKEERADNQQAPLENHTITASTVIKFVVLAASPLVIVLCFTLLVVPATAERPCEDPSKSPLFSYIGHAIDLALTNHSPHFFFWTIIVINVFSTTLLTFL